MYCNTMIKCWLYCISGSCTSNSNIIMHKHKHVYNTYCNTQNKNVYPIFLLLACNSESLLISHILIIIYVIALIEYISHMLHTVHMHQISTHSVCSVPIFSTISFWIENDYTHNWNISFMLAALFICLHHKC